MSNNYAAIILDIQHSRTYDDEQRFYIQDKLFSIIQFMSEYNEVLSRYAHDII